MEGCSRRRGAAEISDIDERPIRGWLGGTLSGLSPGFQQLVRFAIAGGLGTVTNLAVFFVLVDLWGLGPFVGMLLCFGVAVSQNYVLNELWTFATQATGRISVARYAKFVTASLVGLAINAAVLAGLLAVTDFPYAVIPQAAGIGAGMIFNFAMSRWFIFGQERERGDDERAPSWVVPTTQADLLDSPARREMSPTDDSQ